MDEVKALESHLQTIMHANGDLFFFYYGAADGWVPRSYYDVFIAEFPTIRATLCSDQIPHAFVVHHSKVMAEKTLDILRFD
jgi:hypothetical protein